MMLAGDGMEQAKVIMRCCWWCWTPCRSDDKFVSADDETFAIGLLASRSSNGKVDSANVGVVVLTCGSWVDCLMLLFM